MHGRARLLLSVVVAISLAPLSAPAAPASDPGTLRLGGRDCALIPVVRTDIPGGLVSNGTCPGVRPGALVSSEKGDCTLNFLYAGSDGRRYIGTAGHCILGEGPIAEDVGEKVWKRGRGPAAYDANGKRFGEFAYAILKSPKDFALIRIDAGVPASAQLCYFGGPTGTNADRTDEPTMIHHFGNGLVIGDALPARTHLANTLEGRDHVFANGVANLGDSGSGVISSDGRALGVLVTLSVHFGDSLTDIGLIGITRIAPQIAQASRKLGVRLTLKTAKRLNVAPV